MILSLTEFTWFGLHVTYLHKLKPLKAISVFIDLIIYRALLI
jgi:hypothetical protein